MSKEDPELLPCPNPWCEALERDGDFSPAVRLHHFGNYRVVCTSCILEGPLQPSAADAITAWNTRHRIDGQEEMRALLRELYDWSSSAANGLMWRFTDQPIAKKVLAALHTPEEKA